MNPMVTSLKRLKGLFSAFFPPVLMVNVENSNGWRWLDWKMNSHAWAGWRGRDMWDRTFGKIFLPKYSDIDLLFVHRVYVSERFSFNYFSAAGEWSGWGGGAAVWWKKVSKTDDERIQDLISRNGEVRRLEEIFITIDAKNIFYSS